jgi:adenine deaminase
MLLVWKTIKGKDTMRKTALVSLTCFAALIAAPVFGQTAARSFAIEHVRVFDGIRQHADETVLVRHGKIVAAGSRVAVLEGICRVDGQGRTLLPGLIEAHAHVRDEDQLRLVGK